ncbi:MAG: 6-oxocyclohex-1-ene-1-carbonyl-CoA hydratase [Rhodospirillaceae bacterium]|nr:6-oxocyclohex-1-ene-1-carbonyl-CoA hydratase [Rhodospirillaceae bacterium]MBT5938861.1 6-oxocyclohex-1-ene-1-carbonyl-CoA hydratase [Rhodospirillaceae bacterium]
MTADTQTIIKRDAPKTLNDHNLFDVEIEKLAEGMVLYEKRPAKRRDGSVADGLFNAWISFNNPKQYNSYTTDMTKATILAFRKASLDRSVNTVVFTGVGNKAFSTGGNTEEYSEYYAGNPQEYRQYLRLFNDMVSAILGCDKPVIGRVNGMRIGGGQEIGMACDFTIAQDLANFGQAGPKHGSAAIGGATDFLPVMIGCEQAFVSGTLCEPFSAHKACRLGIAADVAPALKIDGKFVANPTVILDQMFDEYGRVIHGEFKTGDEFAAGKKMIAEGEIDLSLLDEKVEAICAKLLETFPECTLKSVEELRKPKLEAWNRNKENARAWLALNMMNEARTGFRAFNRGNKEIGREIDFVELRQALAQGVPWTEELIESLMPGAQIAAE